MHLLAVCVLKKTKFEISLKITIHLSIFCRRNSDGQRTGCDPDGSQTRDRMARGGRHSFHSPRDDDRSSRDDRSLDARHSGRTREELGRVWRSLCCRRGPRGDGHRDSGLNGGFPVDDGRPCSCHIAIRVVAPDCASSFSRQRLISQPSMVDL